MLLIDVQFCYNVCICLNTRGDGFVLGQLIEMLQKS